MTRTLTALRIEGQLAQGVLTQAEAFGGVELRETTRGGGQKEVRRATGMRADAAFRPDGQLASVNLHNEVTFRDPQMRATGDRARSTWTPAAASSSATRSTRSSERGRMTAPRSSTTWRTRS